MSDEQKESRIKVDDLPQAEQELIPEEAQDVKGGFNQVELPPAVKAGSVKPKSNFGDTPGLNGGDMV